MSPASPPKGGAPLLELRVAGLEVGGHRVEGADQRADLVAALVGELDVPVPGRHPPGRVRESPERPLTGAVFQGQGEPLQNYDNVIRTARVLQDPSGARIGSDRITISTVGLLPQIDRYTEEGHPYRLTLSLTSAFSEKRARLVPVTARYGVPELAAAMRRLADRRGGPVSLAWVLISGFNTGEEEAAELARLFRGTSVRLSVLDVNDPGGRFARASDEERSGFLSALSANGLGFVRRYSGGPDIDAACGMLASRARGGAAHEPPPPAP